MNRMRMALALVPVAALLVGCDEKGVLIGKTPLNLPAENGGELYLRLKHEGFYDETLTVPVEPSTPPVFVLFDEPVKPTSELSSAVCPAATDRMPSTCLTWRSMLAS